MNIQEQIHGLTHRASLQIKMLLARGQIGVSKIFLYGIMMLCLELGLIYFVFITPMMPTFVGETQALRDADDQKQVSALRKDINRLSKIKSRINQSQVNDDNVSQVVAQFTENAKGLAVRSMTIRKKAEDIALLQSLDAPTNQDAANLKNNRVPADNAPPENTPPPAEDGLFLEITAQGQYRDFVNYLRLMENKFLFRVIHVSLLQNQDPNQTSSVGIVLEFISSN